MRKLIMAIASFSFYSLSLRPESAGMGEWEYRYEKGIGGVVG
jgi:hypothetical protein